MNANHSSSWPESPQEKTDFRQLQQVHFKSERWQSEALQSLQKNRDELEWQRKLYDSLPCICFTLNSTGRILSVSQFGAASLGYDALELANKSVSEVFYWEDQSRCQAELTELQQPTQISQWETRIIRKNGDILWVKAIARWVPGTESNPIISLVCEDISASKQMEEALRQSEARFQAAVEGSLDAFFIFQSLRDEEGCIIDFTFADLNSKGEKMISMSKEEVIGKRLCELLPINRTGGFFEKYVRVVETGIVLEEEFPLSIPEVPASWLQHQVVPLNDGVAITARDITERKLLEEEMRQTNSFLQTMIDHLPVAVFVKDGKDNRFGEFKLWNRTSEMMFGLTSQQAIGKTVHDLFPKEQADFFGKKDRQAFERGTPEDIPEEPIDSYSLGRRILHTVKVPLYDENHEPEYLLCISEDITERKQAEAELLHKSQALANFSSNLKQLHRLNTAKYDSFEHLFSEYLPTGCEILQLPTGIVSEIDGQSYIIRSVQSDLDFLVPGLKFELKDTYCAAVVKEQKTIAYSQVGKIKEMQNHPVYQNLKLETYIGTPIFVNNQIYGTLNFSSTQARSRNFGTYEQEIIELMAQSIGIFIGAHQAEMERKQAEEALRQQFQREQLVGATLRSIHQSLNLEEILNTTVADVRQFLACDRVIIFRLHADGSGVVVVESVGSDWIPISGTIINDRYFAQSYVQLYQQGRVQAIEDIYTAGLAECHIDLLAGFQVRANLVVPIVNEEKLWGLLVAQQCGETRQWQALEIDLLKSLSTQAAIAIQQSELYQQAQTEIIQRQQAEAALQQQFQQERLIGAISQRIRKSLNLEKILKATVAEVRQAIACDRVIIFRFEPDWSGKVVVESVDKHWPSIIGTSIYDPCFEEVYVLPYQQGRVKAIEDIYTANLSQCHIDLLAQLQVRANLVVPILKGEQLWGLLVAHHCSEARHWQEFEINLLCSLASQVAIAIQQGQLYEQAKSQAKREQALNHLTQAIRSSLDLNTIFSTAVREIGSLLQVDCACIVQYLPERKRWLHVSEFSNNPDLPGFLGTEIPDENNQIADRLKRLEIVKIDDTDRFEDKINKDLAQTFPGAWLLVPLHFDSKVWGSITLGTYTCPYQWQDSEVELICAVADQVAIAIHQAELYKQSRTAAATALTQAQQLEQTVQELQRTQSQLVQSEKMSSLGQLVAGVAHEINNPVSFIYGNLAHAEDYTQDILGLLKLYQQQYPNPAPEIQSEIEAIDLDFLIEDLPKLLDSMKVGAERICEIVCSLRNFSRLSEAEMKAVDIHEGLDSTLMILQNRLKAQPKHPGIQVIKEYGNLPKVECYAGQLNQVFMNLLSNAIDAIDEQNQTRSFEEIKARPSIIRVRTEVNSNQVIIRIADNGPGMTEQVKARLFDPFFTTKPVGVGTGLGLSISYQIVVEKHGGQLHCQSYEGQGTEFVIQIPLWQSSDLDLS